MEGDPLTHFELSDGTISIHSLRVEGDSDIRKRADGLCISIHSLRVEGDVVGRPSGSHSKYFNPLPPCGGRQHTGWRSAGRRKFQSTPSVWRETRDDRWIELSITISIHSLRVEGDHRMPHNASHTPYFNPLPPCGGRHPRIASSFCVSCISIHSLRVEGDADKMRPVF